MGHGRDWSALRKKLEVGNNAGYWVDHIMRNRKRDRLVTRKLKKSGFTVRRFWDDEVYKTPRDCVERIREAVRPRLILKKVEVVT